MWFPRLPSERVLRARPIDGPFALTHHQANTERIYCLNAQAERAGLHRGMGFSDARAFCRDLQSRPANVRSDQRFLHSLARWSQRYCPWVGLDGDDGLVLNIAGSAHLFGGESAMLGDMRHRLARTGLSARLGVADTRGAAWAFAHFSADQTGARLRDLPVAALRLEAKTCTALQRVGLRYVSDVMARPRASVARRFGQDVLMRLDQALGDIPEEISPLQEAPRYAAQMSFPDPIGTGDDIMAAAERLLAQVCMRLKTQEMGARILQLTLRRVDQKSQQVELRLAAPLRDAKRILPLFQRGVDAVDPGFGIDQIQLQATQVEPLEIQQIDHTGSKVATKLDDLVTRIGVRVGLDNVQRFLPADSHIPERSFLTASAAHSRACGAWVHLRTRPIRLFGPDPIAAQGTRPPQTFRWRRMFLTTARATGPERIAPEWWFSDENWRSGVRDYWRVETRQGRRLWLFYTPQNPGWFVHGEFA